MIRREFLIGSAIAAAAVGKVRGQSADKAKLDRISIMSWSFDSIIKGAMFPEDPNRTLDIMDLPDVFAKRYGVHHVEMQHTHFSSTESGYLKEFRDRVTKAKSQVTQINLEFGDTVAQGRGITNMSSPYAVLRLEAIDLTKQWINHAVELNCPRVMVNQGSLAPEVRKDAIATLKTMVEYGKTKKVFVTVEPRGGGAPPAAGAAPAGTAAQLPPRPTGVPWQVFVEVLKAAGAWANPDIGNFPDEESRHAGLRVMYPMSAGNCHVKISPGRYDVAAAIQISKEVGYKGLFAVESSRAIDPDPYVAAQKILDELLKDL